MATVKNTMDDFIAITKALADPNRVRALLALRNGELCVCQIIELLDLAPSTVSKHMSIIKQAGLVVSRKEERWMYYRLPDNKTSSELIRNTLRWIFSMLGDIESVGRDQKKLSGIKRQNPSSLCKSQKGRSQ